MKVDGHLLIDLKNGDEKAFETLFWKYNEHVYHFIYSLLYEKSMAEDLTQNVFLKIWEKHETIDVEQNFDAYLFTIARNLVYKETENRLLSEKLTESLQRQLSDADSLTEERIDAESLREYINSLIEELPPSRREIFRLSRHEHLSYREIAERLSISEKTVETQVNRALRFCGIDCLLMASFVLYHSLLFLYLLLLVDRKRSRSSRAFPTNNCYKRK